VALGARGVVDPHQADAGSNQFRRREVALAIATHEGVQPGVKAQPRQVEGLACAGGPDPRARAGRPDGLGASGGQMGDVDDLVPAHAADHGSHGAPTGHSAMIAQTPPRGIR